MRTTSALVILQDSAVRVELTDGVILENKIGLEKNEPRDIERSGKKKQLSEEGKEGNMVFFPYVNEYNSKKIESGQNTAA